MNLEQISSIISKLHPGASYVVVYKTAASTVNDEAVIAKLKFTRQNDVNKQLLDALQNLPGYDVKVNIDENDYGFQIITLIFKEAEW